MQRLVQKEKLVLQLQSELDNLKSSNPVEIRESVRLSHIPKRLRADFHLHPSAAVDGFRQYSRSARLYTDGSQLCAHAPLLPAVSSVGGHAAADCNLLCRRNHRLRITPLARCGR